MAAPTFHAAGTGSGSINAATPTMPTFTAGDFLLLVHESSSTQGISAPTGWTEMSGSPVDDGSGASAGNPRLQVFTRIAVGGDTAPTLADSGNHNIAQIFSFSGNDTSSPLSGTPVSGTATASTSVSQAGVTTADADCLVVYVLGHAIDSNTATLSSQADASLTSVTEGGDFSNNSNQGGGFAVTSGVLATAGASGTMTGTLSASSKQCKLTFAIKPVPSGTAYTDSGTLTVTPALSGSDLYAHGYTDSGTLTITPALSGSDVAAFVDAATLPTAYTLSGSDLASFTDAGTLPATYTLSGSDIYGHTDTGTLPVTFTLSGSDVAGFVDSSTLPATFTLSGSDIYTPASGGTAYTDSGTLTTTPTLSGSDVAAFTDAATLSTTFTLSGVNSHGYTDAASLPVTFTLSGTQSFQAVDSGTLTNTPTLSGSDVYTSASSATPPITIRTYLVGVSGRTRARSLLNATTATGPSGILNLGGSTGLTHATGISGQTGAT